MLAGNQLRNIYGWLFVYRNLLGKVYRTNCDFDKKLRKVDEGNCDFAKWLVKFTDKIASLTILSVRFTVRFAANLTPLKSLRNKLRLCQSSL